VKLALAIERTAKAELALASELLEVGERHRADHDVFHATRTLAKRARKNAERLEPHAGRYGASLDRLAGHGPEGRPESALLLLDDLRALHLKAAAASLDWTVLGQGAQAARDADLLADVDECHPRTLQALKWTTYRIKSAAPQALTS
jgi:hypothetical protein